MSFSWLTICPLAQVRQAGRFHVERVETCKLDHLAAHCLDTFERKLNKFAHTHTSTLRVYTLGLQITGVSVYIVYSHTGLFSMHVCVSVYWYAARMVVVGRRRGDNLSTLSSDCQNKSHGWQNCGDAVMTHGEPLPSDCSKLVVGLGALVVHNSVYYFRDLLTCRRESRESAQVICASGHQGS